MVLTLLLTVTVAKDYYFFFLNTRKQMSYRTADVSCIMCQQIVNNSMNVELSAAPL